MGNMNKKLGFIIAGAALVGTLGAAAPVVGPVLLTDLMFQQLADEGHDKQSLEDLLNETVSKDKEFVAILPKLTLTERWVPTKSADSMQSEIDNAPWPQPELYRNLPGTQKLLASMRERDEADARIVANKSKAKFDALTEARNVCRIIEKSTPTHIVAPNPTIGLANPENLSAYLEYCGGNASAFKDALTAVVVKRDFAAESAKIDQQMKELSDTK